MGKHYIKLHPEFEKAVRKSIPKNMSMDLLIKWVFIDAWRKSQHSFMQMKEEAENRAIKIMNQQRMQEIENFIAEYEGKNKNA